MVTGYFKDQEGVDQNLRIVEFPIGMSGSLQGFIHPNAWASPRPGASPSTRRAEGRTGGGRWEGKGRSLWCTMKLTGTKQNHARDHGLVQFVQPPRLQPNRPSSASGFVDMFRPGPSMPDTGHGFVNPPWSVSVSSASVCICSVAGSMPGACLIRLPNSQPRPRAPPLPACAVVPSKHGRQLGAKPARDGERKQERERERER